MLHDSEETCIPLNSVVKQIDFSNIGGARLKYKASLRFRLGLYSNYHLRKLKFIFFPFFGTSTGKGLVNGGNS